MPTLAEGLGRAGSSQESGRGRGGQWEGPVLPSCVPAPMANTTSCPKESTRGRSWKSVAQAVGEGR